MSDIKYREIVDLLLDKTENGELIWRETAESETIQVSFSMYSITINQTSTIWSQLNYEISIYNSEGKKIDSFYALTLGSDYLGRVSLLYQKARRQALGADKALDEILNALKDVR